MGYSSIDRGVNSLPSSNKKIRPRDLAEHTVWLRAVARNLIPNREKADEAAQQTMLIALNADKYKIESLRGWLFATLKQTIFNLNVSDSRRRKREKKAAREEAFHEDFDRLPREEWIQAIQKSTSQIKGPIKTALMLYYFDELSVNQIAEITKDNPNLIYKRLYRGMELLRKKLQKQFGTEKPWVVILLPYALDPARSVPPGLAQPVIPASASTWKWGVAALVLLAPLAALIGFTENRKETFPETQNPPGEQSMDSGHRTATIPERKSRTKIQLQGSTDTATGEKDTIKGRVLGPFGNPIPHVEVGYLSRVKARDLWKDGLLYSPVLAKRLRKPGNAQLQPEQLKKRFSEHAKTGIDGGFRMKNAKLDGIFLPFGAYFILGGGHQDTPSGRELFLITVPGKKLEGKITDREGRPLEKVRVSVHYRLNPATLPPMVFSSRLFPDIYPHIATTNSSGKFKFLCFPIDLPVQLEITAEGYETLRSPLNYSGSGTQNFVLKKLLENSNREGDSWDHNTLTGRILDNHGNPLPGILVRIPYPFLLEGGIPIKATTDREGNFILQGLPDGPVPLAIIRKGIFSAWISKPYPSDSENLIFRIPTPTKSIRRVFGKILGPSGKPLQGVKITIPGEGPLRLGRITNPTGTFDIHLFPGDSADMVQLEGFGKKETRAIPAANSDWTIKFDPN